MQDFIQIQNGRVVGNGDVASVLLKNGFNTNALRTNDTLRYDDWKAIDKAVLTAAMRRLTITQALIGRGLVLDLPNGMGSTVLQGQTMGEVGEATISMDGITRGKADRPNYETTYLPLPIIHEDFEFSAREIAASRQSGTPLDTTMAEQAATKVSEKIESLISTGASSFTFGGGTIYGLLDFPSRQTGSLIAHWDHTSSLFPDPVADVIAMKVKALAHRQYGPYILIVPSAYEAALDRDYIPNRTEASTGTANLLTVRDRIMKIGGIQEIIVGDFMTADHVVLVQATQSNIRMVRAMQIQTLQWSTNGGLSFNFKVMAIMVPQLRVDQASKSGIVDFT
jgi:uncharacterized linocin/CFP29 family protein